MFVDNTVVKSFKGEEIYDLFAIASCSVIESQVLKGCKGCNLDYLCRKIERIVVRRLH